MYVCQYGGGCYSNMLGDHMDGSVRHSNMLGDHKDGVVGHTNMLG